MGERVRGPKGWMEGLDQPVVALQVQVSMWSVWTFWDQMAGELGGGTVAGVVVMVMVRLAAVRGWRVVGVGEVWVRALWVSFEVVEVGVPASERSGVGGKAVERGGGW